VPRQNGLLIDGLDRNEAHRRLPRGDGDGLRIRGVILPTFPERHHELSRDEPCRVAAGGKPAAPVMRRTTRLHGHIARWQLVNPPLERVASENTSFHDCTMHIQHAYRNHILREINADRSNLFGEVLELL
jgi:hypothetical protein